MPKRIEIDDAVLAKVEVSCPKYLSPTGFINLLIDRALDTPDTLAEGATAPLPRGGGAIATGASNSSISSSNKTKEIKSLCDELKKHEALIREFWRVKKGSKGETAWKLLMTELTKLQERYGDPVVTEQLHLAINGKWAGVRLSNYEQYKPKGAPAPKQRKLTPEEKQAQDERDHQERLRQMGLI